MATAGAPTPAGHPVPEPCTLVLFGGTGDLSRRKLYPAMLALWRQGLLPSGFRVLAVAAQPWSEARYRDEIAGALRAAGALDDGGALTALMQRLHYIAGDFADGATYEALREALAADEPAAARRLYYLAAPPTTYAAILDHLGRAGLARQAAAGEGWVRLVVEKPFGVDLASADALNRRLHRVLREEQIYRIDHYLGKETVQNILVFRFANGLFEPVWNRNYVSHVQITVAESIGVEGRGAYYEGAGALRDMVQNHLLQLMSLVAMEPPLAFSADHVRDRKVDVLRALQPPTPAEVARRVVRGQYAAGGEGGSRTPAYREEPGVRPDSTTETFVAVEAHLDSWRWAGVPFYLRTGKRLARRVAEVAVEFKRPPQVLFAGTRARLEPNALVLRIQPHEGIFLRFGAKVPGQDIAVQPVEMDFTYEGAFRRELHDAYERLLLDALRGDATLFTRADEAEAAWRFVDAIRAAWSAPNAPPLLPYRPGSWGPAAAARLPSRHGFRWRRP